MTTMTNYQTPTAETYANLDAAFNHFNAELFGHRLPSVLFTLTRKRKAHGYFWAEQFKHRADGDHTHEIALNPDSMDRTLDAVLSTLVHEMTHLEQQEYGTPGSKGNHNKEWVTLMERVGLIPSNTGEPGGKQTGRPMTHYVEEGGAFEVSLQNLLASGFTLPYFTQPRASAEKKKDLSKVKFTCPCCGDKAWAKASMRLVCGECNEEMQGEM
jgi:predicted SprT family Zn-dependent metalloprotease